KYRKSARNQRPAEAFCVRRRCRPHRSSHSAIQHAVRYGWLTTARRSLGLMPGDGKPQVGSLKRVLSRRDLILYGLVILTPTAPYPVYGIVQQTSRGHAVISYLVAVVAMLFTAASYGKMAGAFPAAGSTYTYAQRALNTHV